MTAMEIFRDVRLDLVIPWTLAISVTWDEWFSRSHTLGNDTLALLMQEVPRRLDTVCL